MLGTTLQDFARPDIIWFLLGVVMIFCEMFIPGLVIIFFGAGAIITAAVCMASEISVNLQLVIFSVSSVILLLVTRGAIKKVFVGQKVRQGQEMPVSASEFIGSRGLVIEKIDEKLGGRIELNGSEWKAQSSQAIAVGTPVEVIGQSNVTMIVKPV